MTISSLHGVPCSRQGWRTGLAFIGSKRSKRHSKVFLPYLVRRQFLVFATSGGWGGLWLTLGVASFPYRTTI